MRALFVRLGAGLLGLLAMAGCQSTSAGQPDPGSVTIGGDRTIFLRCEGTGSPTVLLISGQGMSGDAWRVLPNADGSDVEVSDGAVLGQLARDTRTCVYDRPNTTWPTASQSTPVAQPVSARAAVADLHEVLGEAEVPAPYVIAGHSFGGMIAVLYAETYPEEVAGLVLVDPANRYLREVVDPEWWASIQRQRSAAIDPDGEEMADFDDSADAIIAAAPVPPVPAIVLTSDATPPEMIDEEHFPAWIRAHELLADELGARHVTDTDSGHTMQVEQPDLIATAIRDVLAEAQGS